MTYRSSRIGPPACGSGQIQTIGMALGSRTQRPVSLDSFQAGCGRLSAVHKRWQGDEAAKLFRQPDASDRARCRGFGATANTRRRMARAALVLRLGPDLTGRRAGVTQALDVIDLIAALEGIEVAGQQAVAVEIEKPALLGHEEPEILRRRKLGDLPEELVLGVVQGVLGAVEPGLELGELIFSNTEGFVDRRTEVGGLELALQAVGLMAHHEVLAPGNAELDVNDRRDGAV